MIRWKPRKRSITDHRFPPEAGTLPPLSKSWEAKGRHISKALTAIERHRNGLDNIARIQEEIADLERNETAPSAIRSHDPFTRYVPDDLWNISNHGLAGKR